jgi:hypothetical protein
MVFIYPVGIPLGYMFLLFRFRRQINPLGCGDELNTMRARRELENTHPGLQAIDFLFSCYRPGAWWFEVYDSVRRITMTGLVRYIEKTSGPPVAGILLSRLSRTRTSRRMRCHRLHSGNFSRLICSHMRCWSNFEQRTRRSSSLSAVYFWLQMS